MSKTRIEWTDATWNPVTGCTPVSEGCEHCYARRMANRLRGRAGYPADDPFRVTLHPDRLAKPPGGKPKMVFVCSMSDVFHEDIGNMTRNDIFGAAYARPQHIFQVLTKRPGKALSYLGQPDRPGAVQVGAIVQRLVDSPHLPPIAWPLPNVWLGITAENQPRLDERWPHLAQTPAAVRFVSIEPMLGPVDLAIPANNGSLELGGIDWVIVGGETGPGARPMHPDWPRKVRDDCQEAGVPFFFKGWGEWVDHTGGDGPEMSCGIDPGTAATHVWPDREASYRVGKKAAGRLLDGREWEQYPETNQ